MSLRMIPAPVVAPLLSIDAAGSAAGDEPPEGRPGLFSALCRNCDRSFHSSRPMPRFCPQCGQAVDTRQPTMRELVREFVSDNLSPRGTLWRTLALLVALPGRLTTLHWLGRRTHHVPPIRLYLSASFVFFLVLKLIAGGPNVPVVVGHINFDMRHSSSAALPAGGVLLFSSDGKGPLPTIVVTLETGRVGRNPDMSREMDARANQCLRAGRDDCGWLDRMATRAAQRWAADPGLSQMAFVRHALEIAPYEVFLMLPVYAAIVALAYRRRHQSFGDHLVFGLHLHAFWFIAAAVALLLPRMAVVGIAAYVCWHALQSLQEAYGGSWHAAALRGAVVSMVYVVLFFVVTVATSFCLFVS